MWASTLLSPYLQPKLSSLYSKLCKSKCQCEVRIDLYTLSSRWGLCMGCCIMKGYTSNAWRGCALHPLEQIEQKILLLDHVNSFATKKILTKVMTGI